LLSPYSNEEIFLQSFFMLMTVQFHSQVADAWINSQR